MFTLRIYNAIYNTSDTPVERCVNVIKISCKNRPFVNLSEI